MLQYLFLQAMAQLIEQPLEQRDDTILIAERHEPFDHNLVDGIMVPSFITQQRVDELKTLKLRPDDVFVVTYPKSGIHSRLMIIIHII